MRPSLLRLKGIGKNPLKVETDGSSVNTVVMSHDGIPITGIRDMNIQFHPSDPCTVTLSFYALPDDNLHVFDDNDKLRVVLKELSQLKNSKRAGEFLISSDVLNGIRAFINSILNNRKGGQE